MGLGRPLLGVSSICRVLPGPAFGFGSSGVCGVGWGGARGWIEGLSPRVGRGKRSQGEGGRIPSDEKEGTGHMSLWFPCWCLCTPSVRVHGARIPHSVPPTHRVVWTLLGVTVAHGDYRITIVLMDITALLPILLDIIYWTVESQ